MPDITLHDLDDATYAAVRREFLEGLAAEGTKPAPRKLGGWKGRVRIAPEFDEWPDDLADAFGMRGGSVP